MDIDSYIHIFENKNWTEILSMEINDAVNALTNFILNASNPCIPMTGNYYKGKRQTLG